MQVSYEVYTLSGGRWLLDSRYDDEARDVAIDEARQLAKRGRVEATKVVQEDYDEGTHFVREWTVYSTRPNRLRGRALDRFNQLRSANNDCIPQETLGVRAAEKQGSPIDPSVFGSLAQRRPQNRRKQVRQFAALVGKVIVIIIASFGFATLTTLFYARGWIA